MPRGTPTRTRKARTSDNDNGKSNVTVLSAPNPLEDEIRTRAYLLYEEEGRQQGRDQEYWLRAESEILEKHGLRRA